jgi:hypothetical protein
MDVNVMLADLIDHAAVRFEDLPISRRALVEQFRNNPVAQRTSGQPRGRFRNFPTQLPGCSRAIGYDEIHNLEQIRTDSQ